MGGGSVKLTTVNLLARGPGDATIKVWFPFNCRHLEFRGGPIAKTIPVTIRYRTRVRRRVPWVVRKLIRRLKVNGYECQLVKE